MARSASASKSEGLYLGLRDEIADVLGRQENRQRGLALLRLGDHDEADRMTRLVEDR